VGPFLLDEKPVPGITPFLTQPGTVTGKPYRLAANAGKSFQGSNVLGMGFVLEPEEAERLIKKNPKNKDVLFPYLNGDDLNSRPDQSPSRWVINFFDWPLEKAEKYPDCMKIVRDKVYPDRMAIKGTDPTAEQRRRIWWRFTRPAMDLYSAIAGLKRVLVTAQTSKHLCFTFIPPNVVYSHTVIVIANSNCWAFSIGQSSPHEIWVRSYASTLETRLRYLPTDCFENFPFPHSLGTEQIAILNRLGEMYHEHRSRLMLANSEGLTKTYNRFNDPSEADADVQQLRELHVEMDKAVAAAYGWDDLDLGHGFHETKQGARFTISDAARREVLERLLKLNHQRYEEEVCQGLHEKKGKSEGKRRGRKSSISMTGPTLFDKQDEEPEQKKGEPELKSAPIDEFETDDVMGAFRQAARGRGLMDRDTLLKEVALVLGFQRLGPRIEETLRNHLRAAIRRRIIEAEGPLFVRAATAAMADYTLEDLREAFRSVMQKGAQYEREDVIHALARYLGFSRVTETIGGAIKSAINSAIRHGILGYERAVIWREE
jgi:hypothetical protein